MPDPQKCPDKGGKVVHKKLTPPAAIEGGQHISSAGHILVPEQVKDLKQHVWHSVWHSLFQVDTEAYSDTRLTTVILMLRNMPDKLRIRLITYMTKKEFFKTENQGIYLHILTYLTNMS